jgi:hypothetical protein
MRKLIIAVALATLVGSPALAQSYMGSVGSGNIAPLPHDGQTEHWARPYEPRAAAPAAAHRATPRSSDQLYLYSGDRPARGVTSRSSGRLYLYGGDAVQTERYRGGSGGDPNLDVQLRRESQQGQW